MKRENSRQAPVSNCGQSAETDLITGPVADIHMHVIPDVDDGSDSFETSLKMLRSAYSQGVRAVICTPHGGCFFHWGSRRRAAKNYRQLTELCRKELPDLKLYMGAEVRFVPGTADQSLKLLKSGKMPTLAGSRYVLTEFENYGMTFGNALYSLYKIMDLGFIPVIAHMDRYPNLFDREKAERVHGMGCLIQINTDSVSAGTADSADNWVNILLKDQLIDFIGSDAHNMGNRPPMIQNAVRTLADHYDSEYVRKILSENAAKLILPASVLKK